MTITGDAEAATFEAAWNQWHVDRERYYGDPLGWVSITALHWLAEEFETVADLPGRWRADAAAVYVEGIDGTERLEPAEGAPGLLVEAGDRRIEVIAEPARWRCGCTIRSLHTCWRTTVFRPIRPVHGGVSPAHVRPTRSRRPSPPAPSSKDSSTTTTRLASLTSNWPATHCSWSPSAARRRIACAVHRCDQRRDNLPRRRSLPIGTRTPAGR